MHRELKEHIINFRLTTPERESVRTTLKSLGIGNLLSDGAACRVVLLAALGVGKLQLANSSSAVNYAGNNWQNFTIAPSTRSGKVSKK